MSESLTPIGDALRLRIADTLALLPEGTKGALVLAAEADGERGRAHIALKLNDTWKIAAGAEFTWDDKKPAGWIAVQTTW